MSIQIKSPYVFIAVCLMAMAFVTPVIGEGVQETSDPGATGGPKPIYVTLREGGGVLELDGPSFAVKGAVTYDTITRDGSVVFASNTTENQVLAIDTHRAEIVKRIPVGVHPKGIKLSPDDSLVLVANEDGGTVSLIDAETMEVVVSQFSLGEDPQPHNIIFAPNGGTAYVTLQADDQVVVLGVRSDELYEIDRIPLGTAGTHDGPHNLDTSPDGRILYVNLRFTDQLAVIDVAERDVIAYIPLSRGHHGVDVTPDGRWVYVSGIGSHYINVIDPVALKRVALIDVGEGPHGVRTSVDGRTLYVTDNRAGKAVVASLPAGWQDSGSSSDNPPVFEELVTDERQYTGPFWVAVPGNH